MHVSESSVVVPRPRDEVWDFIADVANLPVWSPAVVSARSVTDGGLRPGRVVEGVSRFLFTSIPWTGVVVDVDAPHRFSFKSVEAPFAFQQVTTFKELRGGTELHARVEYESGLGGVFEAMADPVVSRIYSRLLRASLRNAADVLAGEVDSDAARHLHLLYGLSRREVEILGLLAQGLSNVGVAAATFLSPRTVEAHISRIFVKMQLEPTDGMTRRVAAVLEYQRAVRAATGKD